MCTYVCMCVLTYVGTCAHGKTRWWVSSSLSSTYNLYTYISHHNSLIWLVYLASFFWGPPSLPLGLQVSWCTFLVFIQVWGWGASKKTKVVLFTQQVLCPVSPSPDPPHQLFNTIQCFNHETTVTTACPCCCWAQLTQKVPRNSFCALLPGPQGHELLGPLPCYLAKLFCITPIPSF